MHLRQIQNDGGTGRGTQNQYAGLEGGIQGKQIYRSVTEQGEENQFTQTDQIDENGFRTTLKLVRVGGDNSYDN